MDDYISSGDRLQICTRRMKTDPCRLFYKLWCSGGLFNAFGSDHWFILLICLFSSFVFVICFDLFVVCSWTDLIFNFKRRRWILSWKLQSVVYSNIRMQAKISQINLHPTIWQNYAFCFRTLESFLKWFSWPVDTLWIGVHVVSSVLWCEYQLAFCNTTGRSLIQIKYQDSIRQLTNHQWLLSKVRPVGPYHFKGTVARDFTALVFFIKSVHLGPWFISYFFFKFGFKFAELFKFEVWLPAALYSAESKKDCKFGEFWFMILMGLGYWRSPIDDFFTWLSL